MHERSRLYTVLTLSIFLVAFLCTTTLTAADTGEQSAERDARALQEKYNTLISLTFSFEQVTRTGTRERKGSGNATFYRFQAPSEDTGDNGAPARQSVMRWNYTEPDPQIIVSDGETLSIYTANDKQLIRTPAKELESDITYAFFAGTRNLLDDFVAKPVDDTFMYSSANDLRTLLLVPRRPHNQILDVQVWYDEKKLIHHMLIRDHFDSMTELNFSEIKADSLEPGDRMTLNDIITFPIPPGTEIISR